MMHPLRYCAYDLEDGTLRATAATADELALWAWGKDFDCLRFIADGHPVLPCCGNIAHLETLLRQVGE